MGYRIELHPLALQEMEESYQWYEDRSPGLGRSFLAAIQKRFDRIADLPESYAKKKGDYREAPLPKFPFVVIYEVHAKRKTVFVTYVFHTKRDPSLKYKR